MNNVYEKKTYPILSKVGIFVGILGILLFISSFFDFYSQYQSFIILMVVIPFLGFLGAILLYISRIQKYWYMVFLYLFLIVSPVVLLAMSFEH